MRRHHAQPDPITRWGELVDALLREAYHPLDRLLLAMVTQAVIDISAPTGESAVYDPAGWMNETGTAIVQAVAPDFDVPPTQR